MACPLGVGGAMSAPPAVFFALFVAPRLRAWGATAAELERTWPGDELVPHPGFVWTNAVTIEHPVARFDTGHVLVLGGVTDSSAQLQAGRPSSTWAFIVEPLDAGRCRLVVRSRAAGLAARLQGPAQFVMQHKMMLGIKQRAEGTWSASSADVLIPLSWFAAAAVAAVHGGRALRGKDGRLRSVVMSGLAGIGVELLLFWDVPGRARAALVSALAGSLLLGQRRKNEQQQAPMDRRRAGRWRAVGTGHP